MSAFQSSRLGLLAVFLAVSCGPPAHDGSGFGNRAARDGGADIGSGSAPDAGSPQTSDAVAGGQDSPRLDTVAAPDGPACTDLNNTAPLVYLDVKAAGMPASYKAMGGSVGDGVYQLTKAEAFGVPAIETLLYRTFRFRYTIRVSGNATAMEMAATTEEPGRSETFVSRFELSTADMRWTRTQVCPTAASPETAGYTATTTEITLYDENAAYVFTKR